MQIVRLVPWDLVRAIAILVASAALQGCGWERTMRFQSPSGMSAIEIWQTRFVNTLKARVELVTKQKRIVLYTQQREAWIEFVHVYWSPDEATVGVFAANGELAADVKTGRPIPFERIRKEFAQSIRDTYHLPPGEDPIDWAHLYDSQFAFLRLHPEIHLTYH